MKNLEMIRKSTKDLLIWWPRGYQKIFNKHNNKLNQIRNNNNNNCLLQNKITVF